MKKLMLAAALSVLAFAAVPSMASAFTTTPALTLQNGATFPQPFTSTSGAGSLLTEATEVHCTSDTNSGEFENAHTGTVKISFHGCTEEIFGSSCTTAGSPSGTITTQLLTFHTVYLKPANAGTPHERPGILFTPNANGKFAEFDCLGGFITVVVKGNGVLGTVTAPTIGGAASHTATINVSATSSGQQHTQTQEGETYGLESSINGGALEPAYENAGNDTVTFSNAGVEAKTTTETP